MTANRGGEKLGSGSQSLRLQLSLLLLLLLLRLIKKAFDGGSSRSTLRYDSHKPF